MSFFRSNQSSNNSLFTGTINTTICFNEPVEPELPSWNYPTPKVVTREIPIDPNRPQPQLKWHKDEHMRKKKRYQDGSVEYKATQKDCLQM